MLGFLGPNGAGKTTTMRAVFGLVQPDPATCAGTGGRSALGERLRFGYMPEERGLYPRMQVGEQVAYFGRLHGLSPARRAPPPRGWLERLGLGDRAEAKVEELSHGNQQRAQLAAALVHEPELLVLDEPFAGLDPLAVQTLAEVLRGEAERGAAVLFSSHQLDLVEDICEDVAIIDRGQLVATGGRRLRPSASGGASRCGSRARPPEWRPGVAGVELVGRRDGEMRVLAARDVDPATVLASAAHVARVVEFDFGPPSLAELFLEVVAMRRPVSTLGFEEAVEARCRVGS